MSAGGFREWARAEAVDTFGVLDELHNLSIGIDGDQYLHNLLTAPLTREPLLPALGGIPFALHRHVTDDIERFKSAHITPVFVFNGLTLAGKDRAVVGKASRKASRFLNEAWTTYDDGRGEAAVIQFGKACSYRISHVTRWLQTFLRKQGFRVQTALYSAAAQICHLLTNRIISAAYGSVDCLLFGADRVITHFDWDEKRFYWVDLSPCLGKLRLNREQFTDLMLLSGCSFISALPEVDSDVPLTRISAARNLLGGANLDGHAVCLNAKDEDYTDAFRKARFAIKHCLILQENGAVTLTNAASAPGDVHFFIGQRLPDEVYYYLFRGIVSPRVLEWRTRNEIYETQPLDGGSSPAYRDFIENKLPPLRAQSLALLTRLLHRYYQRTDVDLVCWFKEEDKKGLAIPDLIEDSAANANTWHVPRKDFPVVVSNDVLDNPLIYAIEALLNDNWAKGSVTPRDANKAGTLQGLDELLGNTIWRFLHDRGYINPDHTLSAWGTALKLAFKKAADEGYEDRKGDHDAAESIFMAFELLRLDMLNAKTLFSFPTYSGAPLRGTETDKSHTLLISRVASLGTLKHDSIGYTGPLSRHLLAYHQITAAVRGSLRDLVEMHACNMLLSGSVSRSIEPKELEEYGSALPLLREPNLGLSLVVKSYLDEQSNDPAKRADVRRWFNHALDIPGDLKRAWKLWASVNAGIQGADSSIVTNETRKLFRTADEWLQQKLQCADDGWV